jgi:hypothetical protein
MQGFAQTFKMVTGHTHSQFILHTIQNGKSSSSSSTRSLRQGWQVRTWQGRRQEGPEQVQQGWSSVPCRQNRSPPAKGQVRHPRRRRCPRLLGNAARDNGKTRIIPRHIQLAVRNDEELNKLFGGVTIAQGGVLPNIHSVLVPKSSKTGEVKAAKAPAKKAAPAKKEGKKSKDVGASQDF